MNKVKKPLRVLLAVLMFMSVVQMMGLTAYAGTKKIIVNLSDFKFDENIEYTAKQNKTINIKDTENINDYEITCTLPSGSIMTGGRLYSTGSSVTASIAFNNNIKIKEIIVTCKSYGSFYNYNKNEHWTNSRYPSRSFTTGSEPSSFDFAVGGSTGVESFEITFEAPSVSLDKSELTLHSGGESEALTATLEIVSGKVVWSSSDEDVATVDSNGVVTSVKAGTATITATFESDKTIKSVCSVTVRDFEPDEEITVGSYKYTVLSLNGNKGTVGISAADKSIAGNIELPGSLTIAGVDFTVTEILREGFYELTNLTGVTIPDGVTYIGEWAFYGCTNLNSVTIPDGVTYIGKAAFSRCTYLNSVTIPAGVKSIGESAFYTVPINNVTFETDNFDMGIYKNSFKDMTLPTEKTGDATVKIYGLNNNTEINHNVRIGQMLKPVVEGYSGDKVLYYNFGYDLGYGMANVSGLTFPTSNTIIADEGYSSFYMSPSEAYAAFSAGFSDDTIPLTCNVYEPVLTDGRLSFNLVATVTYSDIMDDSYANNDTAALEAEFSENNVLVMQKGDGETTFAKILGLAGFTHLNCSNVNFNSVTIAPVTIAEGDSVTVVGTDKTATVTPVKTGLSKITFKCYTNKCTYHDTTESPVEGSLYIYVVEKPELTSTADTITVTDNTASPAASTYRIGLINNGTIKDKTTAFTGLKSETEYDVIQELNLIIDGETYIGRYHNYISTKKAYNITCSDCTNGKISVDKKAASEGDTVTVTATPDSGYELDTLYYIAEGTAVQIPITDGTFTMPAGNVTVYATFVASVCYIDADENGEFNGNDVSYRSVDAALSATPANESEGKPTVIRMLANDTENITVAGGRFITLDLNGFVLKPASTESQTITVQGGLTLTDSSKTMHYFNENENGLWVWDENETTTCAHSVTGGILTGSTSKAAVKVEGGKFILEKGNIAGNNISETGAGVYIWSGSFEMKGGLIAGNIAYYGGGVGVCGTGSFTMTDGEISGNIANAEYGCGGGVLVKESGIFNMTGGKITGNKATSKGAGISYEDGTVTLGGTAKITGNKVGDTDSNLFIVKGKYVTVSTSAPFADSAEMGVTLYNMTSYQAEDGRFASNGTAEDLNHFKSDSASYGVRYNKSGWLELAVPRTVNVSGSIENGTVNVSKATAYAEDEITVTATPAKGYIINTLYYVVEGTAGQTAITDGTFTMPAGNVTVYATFKIPETSKEIETETNITVSDDTGAAIQSYIDAQKGSINHDTEYKFAVKEQTPTDVSKRTAIENIAGTNRTVTFFDATFTKTETIDNVAQSPVEIEDTGDAVLSFTVAYDMTGKCNLGVFRYHGTEATELTRVYTALNPKDGTYYVEGIGADTKVTVFASKFSAYAMGSTELPDVFVNTGYSVSLTLSKNINVNFKMKNMGSGFETSKLAVTVDGTAVEAVTYDTENKIVSCVLKAVEPKDIGTDLHIVITYDGVTVKDLTYSVTDYCEAIFAAYEGNNEKYANLNTICEALLNYGKWAEDYYNEYNKLGKEASTLNAGHMVTLDDSYEFTGVKESKVFSGEYADEGCTAYLSLGSTIKLNFIIKNCKETLSTGYDESGEADEDNPQNFSVMNDKDTPEQIEPNRVKVTTEDTETIVSIDLYASQLSSSYTLELKDVDTSKFCITYGVYNYCKDAQGYTADDGFTDTLKTLCRAIHNYSVAVDAYIAGTK